MDDERHLCAHELLQSVRQRLLVVQEEEASVTSSHRKRQGEPSRLKLRRHHAYNKEQQAKQAQLQEIQQLLFAQHDVLTTLEVRVAVGELDTHMVLSIVAGWLTLLFLFLCSIMFAPFAFLFLLLLY
jgi:hypothetical protein